MKNDDTYTVKYYNVFGECIDVESFKDRNSAVDSVLHSNSIVSYGNIFVQSFDTMNVELLETVENVNQY